MEMIGKVWRMKLRDKLSHSAIAKATGLSRTTVKKWLKAPGDKAPKYVRESVDGKLTGFVETLDQSLKTDSHRPKHGRRTGRALFKQIQALGYRGGYSMVTNFIRAWREKTGKLPSKAFVPLSFELGEAFQFDWSDEGLVVGGVFYKVQVSHLKLCASRAFWLVAYPSPRAIAINIEIMRAFVHVRSMAATHQDLAKQLAELQDKTESLAMSHDTFSRNTRAQLKQVFDALRELMTPPDPPKRPIGFVTHEDKKDAPKGASGGRGKKA
jgi:hypothetical protein